MPRKAKKTPPTVITLTLPQEGELVRHGTLLIQRGEWGKLTAFEYRTLSEIMLAVQQAMDDLTALEKFPPAISEVVTTEEALPAEEMPESEDQDVMDEAAEATPDPLPLGELEPAPLSTVLETEASAKSQMSLF